MTVILFALATTALWYLGAAADITYPIRIRLPQRLDVFLQCPACAGTWYGAACGFYGWAHGWTFFDLVGIESVIASALGAMVWTPLLAALLMRSLATVGEALSNGTDEA